MDWTVYWFMFPVCIAIATIAMASGISGAAMLTPVLILGFPLLGVPVIAAGAAIGMSLLTEFFGFGSGVLGYVRRNLVHYKTVRTLAMVSVPVAALAGFASQLIDPRILKGLYGLLMLPLAVVMWRKAREAQHSASTDSGSSRQPISGPNPSLDRVVDSEGSIYEWRTLHRRLSMAVTAVGAGMAGLTSTGMGEVEVPWLVRGSRMPVAVAVATSVVLAATTVLGAAAAHILTLIDEGGVGAVPWNVVIYTIPGAVIGGQIGPRIQGRVPARRMERGIAVLFLVVGLLFLANATFFASVVK